MKAAIGAGVTFGLAALIVVLTSASADPAPRGRLVNLGSHRLHFDCRGQGAPTVILESGFDEFSFDWELVQAQVATFVQVCSYDRAGYAWSDPGPSPRTFDQMNVELHAALKKLGLRGPFVLAGHAFGGPVVRNFAKLYPHEVAGIVLIEAVSEDQRFEMWQKAVLMRDGAKGKAIPKTHLKVSVDDALADSPYFNPKRVPKIAAPFDRLPAELQSLRVWGLARKTLASTEENERTWSPEYFARWHDDPKASTLGSIPLIVLSRERGEFHDLDIPAVQQEIERKSNQQRLVTLSNRGEQRMVASGEDMQVESPGAVVKAISDVVNTARGLKH